MLQTIYTAVIIAIVIYICFAKRRIDFLTIYFASSLFYYLPLITGLLNDMYYDHIVMFRLIKINDITYFFGILNMLTVWEWMFIYDNKRHKNTLPVNLRDIEISSREYKVVKILGFIETCLILLSLYNSSSMIFNNFNKVSFLANMGLKLGIIMTFTETIGLYITIYAFSRKNVPLGIKTVAFLYLFFSLLTGHRSDLVISIIVAITFRSFKYFGDNRYQIFNYIKKHKVLVIAALVGALFIIPLKISLRYFIQGRWLDGIKYLFIAMFDSNTYLVSESNSITLYVQKVLENGVIHFMNSYPISVTCLMPFSETLLGDVSNFYGYFQESFFPGITQNVMGLAGTFWGEAYSNGGWLFMLFMMNIHCFLICKIEDRLFRKNYDIYTCIWLSLIGYMSFFIHRFFLEDLMNKIKFLLVLCVVVKLLDLVKINIKVTQHKDLNYNYKPKQ